MEYTAIQVVGISAGIFLVVSILPQVYKILRTKQGKGISLIAYTISSISQMLWITYGILKDDLKIILTNSVTLVLTIIIMLLVVYYERKVNRQMDTILTT